LNFDKERKDRKGIVRRNVKSELAKPFNGSRLRVKWLRVKKFKGSIASLFKGSKLRVQRFKNSKPAAFK
jgi:hypothetical protein